MNNSELVYTTNIELVEKLEIHCPLPKSYRAIANPHEDTSSGLSAEIEAVRQQDMNRGVSPSERINTLYEIPK